jgi:Prealbumin-like fold domain
MKSIMYLFSFVMLCSMAFKNDFAPGDPVPGADIKLGRKPPGGGQIIATGVTDKNGTVEFKNLPEGAGYYLEFGIREKGIKNSTKGHTVVLGMACTSDRMARPIVITEKWDDVEATITVTGNTIRTIINTSRDNIKGPISTSRSNIKQ